MGALMRVTRWERAARGEGVVVEHLHVPYLARSTIEAHGGTVVAESSPERGTALSVRLPRAMVAPSGEMPDDESLAGRPRCLASSCST